MMDAVKKNVKKISLCLALLASLALLPMAAGCATSQSTVSLRVLYAGSLIIPFDQLEKTFEAKRPDIAIEAEGHGSVQVIRQVTDIHGRADVVISADHALIPMLMYNTNDPDTGKPYADWYVQFASNEMAIAYAPTSKFADEINENNWYQIINRDGVRLGIADPRFDANGYRALMMLKLAESFYHKPTIFFDTLQGKFVSPITSTDENGRSVIRVPEIVETKSDSSLVMRGYSVQLLPLLETGNVDYVIEYLSVIKQHGLRFVKLPPQIHLGAEQYQDLYRQVTVKLDFQRFASVKPEFIGETIGYGVTVPENASHPREAETFVGFLLGPDGRKVLQDFDHPLIVPARADRMDKLPASLKSLCVPKP
jgi:molybdate/tungstate transport system substrate-binding protein